MSKEKITSNYRPITYPPVMWKILTAKKRPIQHLYITYHFQKSKIRGTYDLLNVDKHILKVSKRWKIVAMAWIDHEKANDMVPQSWIIEYLKMYRISDKVIKFIIKAMKNFKVELTTREKRGNQGRHLPGKFTLAITICNSIVAAQLYT